MVSSEQIEPADVALALDESWPLVGRVALVDRTLGALSGRSRSVFLYGASGVGKSRLASAVADRLAGAGWVVLSASGNSALSAVPLGALAPVLAREPGSIVTAAADPVSLFGAASRAVERLADGRPVLLSVDDVSVVDSVSVTLVAQLAESGLLRLIATVRESDPLPDALIPLASAGDSLRLDVPELDVDHVAELLTRVLGAPIAHRDAVELHRVAHGNPLFLRELAIGAAEAGSLVQHAGLWQLDGEPVGTPALRDLIRARLRNLSDGERDAVERLALCEPLAFDEFARPDAADSLANLEQHGLIRIDESSPRMRISLAHPHYAAAVRDSLPRIRAISLLLEQADLVAGREMNPGDELRVAIWRLDAGRPSDPALLARCAALARMAHDHRTAERLASAAVDAGSDDPAAMLLRGQLLWSLGRADEAVATLADAERIAVERDAPPALVAGIAAARADVFGGDPLGNRRGIEMLESLEQSLPEQAATLALSKAVLLLNLEYVHDALAHVDIAAAASGDSPLERAVLDLSRAMPLSALGRTEVAIDTARTAIDVTGGDSTVLERRRGQVVLAHALIAGDRLDDARSTVVDSLHDAIRKDDEITARLDEFMMGRIFWQRGRLDTAARWFRDTLGGAELRGPRSLREPSLCFLAVIAAEQGDLERARELRARVVPGLDADNSVTALADAWIHATGGATDAAAATVLARVDAVQRRGAFMVAAALLHNLLRFGSQDHARTAADRLAVLSAETGSPEIERRHAHAMAEAEADAAALRAVGTEWEALGHVLYAAEAWASAGQAARADGRGREATADLQRSATLAAACEGARTPLLRFADGAEPLTPREREVASLAAQGLSSNEIARRLYLSPRTVNNHLQSTYAKLGIRGRHELQV